jgi:hypothetical protein
MRNVRASASVTNLERTGGALTTREDLMGSSSRLLRFIVEIGMWLSSESTWPRAGASFCRAISRANIYEPNQVVNHNAKTNREHFSHNTCFRYLACMFDLHFPHGYFREDSVVLFRR